MRYIAELENKLHFKKKGSRLAHQNSVTILFSFQLGNLRIEISPPVLQH